MTWHFQIDLLLVYCFRDWLATYGDISKEDCNLTLKWFCLFPPICEHVFLVTCPKTCDPCHPMNNIWKCSSNLHVCVAAAVWYTGLDGNSGLYSPESCGAMSSVLRALILLCVSLYISKRLHYHTLEVVVQRLPQSWPIAFVAMLSCALNTRSSLSWHIYWKPVERKLIWFQHLGYIAKSWWWLFKAELTILDITQQSLCFHM